MNIQIIEREGSPEYAVIPYAEFERLREAAETLDDIQRYDLAMKQLDEGEEETFPAAFVNRLLAGEPALRVWREYRGLTLAALGKGCGGCLPPLSPRSRKASASPQPSCCVSSPPPCAATWTTCFPCNQRPVHGLQRRSSLPHFEAYSSFSHPLTASRRSPRRPGSSGCAGFFSRCRPPGKTEPAGGRYRAP